MSRLCGRFSCVSLAEGFQGRLLARHRWRMLKEELWEELIRNQGKIFHTVKGLEFRYQVIGGELFVDRRSKSITRATVEKAWDKLQAMPESVTGPKSLGVFGAPYVWAIFKELKIV